MKPAARRLWGIVTGLVLGGAVVAWSGAHELHHPGPMNTGHEHLACGACHQSAPGTLRQQLQTAARGALGATSAPVDVGYRRVDNEQCLACHERADDRHPVFRFLEPRFADVRAELHPEQCVSCHREHSGERVTVAETTFCRGCHADTAFDNDPLDVPHRTLVETEAWSSCLGCHDYHGNHAHEVPVRLDDAFPADWITRYFAGGASPYGQAIERAREPSPTGKVRSR